MPGDDSIDSVWEKMKRDEEERLAKTNTKVKPKVKKRKKKRKKAKSSSKPCSLSPAPPEEAPLSSTPTPTQTNDVNVADLKTSILAWSQSANPSDLGAGDSDDSDDDETVGNKTTSATTTTSTREWTIVRLSSAISSTDIPSRVNGLQALRLSIDDLVQQQPPSVPQLDLPPPYDPSAIVLTHREQGALVSDMSSKHWSQWDRTNATLMSQFRSLSTNDNEAPPPTNSTNASSLPISTRITTQLQALLNGCGCDIFRRFGDSVEKCRMLSIRCVEDLALSGIDFSRHIGLLMPAVFARFPPASFDATMDVFVHNSDDHDCHRRGGAVARQDRDDSRVIQIVETSEEIRLALCDLLSSLVRGTMARGELSILDPYFADLMLALFTMLRDPCPEVKMGAS